MLAEIPTELQSNIEKAADALIEDETNKIAKVIIRLFLIGNRCWYCVLCTRLFAEPQNELWSIQKL